MYLSTKNEKKGKVQTSCFSLHTHMNMNMIFLGQLWIFCADISKPSTRINRMFISIEIYRTHNESYIVSPAEVLLSSAVFIWLCSRGSVFFTELVVTNNYNLIPRVLLKKNELQLLTLQKNCGQLCFTCELHFI